jgi:hypothetical protein
LKSNGYRPIAELRGLNRGPAYQVAYQVQYQSPPPDQLTIGGKKKKKHFLKTK